MRWTTLTIEIERGFLASPVAEGGRVRRFLQRAFERDIQERKFRPSWEGAPLLARREGDTLVLHAPDLDQWARTGDRLWLQAAVGAPEGYATLYDGSAVMVQHFLSRADPNFAARLVAEDLPPADSVEIGTGHYRAQWRQLLERAVELAAEYEARSAASLAALINLGAEDGADIQLAARDETAYPARDMLDDILASERAGRQVERTRRVLPEQPGRYDLEPTRDTPRLLAMASAVVDAFAAQPADATARSDEIATLLRSIASGTPTEGGE